MQSVLLLLPLDSREEQEQAGAVPERQSDKSKVFPRSFLISSLWTLLLVQGYLLGAFGASDKFCSVFSLAYPKPHVTSANLIVVGRPIFARSQQYMFAVFQNGHVFRTGMLVERACWLNSSVENVESDSGGLAREHSVDDTLSIKSD